MRESVLRLQGDLALLFECALKTGFTVYKVSPHWSVP